MLSGIKKNINENYNNKILKKKESNIKKKEDVNVSEAFELYLLKNFLNIKLNNVFYLGKAERSSYVGDMSS